MASGHQSKSLVGFTILVLKRKENWWNKVKKSKKGLLVFYSESTKDAFKIIDSDHDSTQQSKIYQFIYDNKSIKLF